MVPLLLNKSCRAEHSFCWLISSCNPWTVLVRAASICSGQRQVNIWSSWSALVSWDCQSCRSSVPLTQTNHWFARGYKTQSRGWRAPCTPPAQRTMSLDRIPVTQIRPDTMHCSPETPITALGVPELPLPAHQGFSNKVYLLGSFSHPRWTHNTLWRAWLIREPSQRAFNHLTEAEDIQAMRSSDKGALQQ